MPLLATLHEAPASVVAIFSCLIAGVAVLLALYAMFRKENREDGQTTMQRLHTLEVQVSKHETRHTGFQVEIERVADQARQAREVMSENHKRDLEQLRYQIKDVSSTRDLVHRMDERFISTKKEMEDLSSKMDQILIALTKK